MSKSATRVCLTGNIVAHPVRLWSTHERTRGRVGCGGLAAVATGHLVGVERTMARAPTNSQQPRLRRGGNGATVVALQIVHRLERDVQGSKPNGATRVCFAAPARAKFYRS
jgi:hypothetical protein